MICWGWFSFFLLFNSLCLAARYESHVIRSNKSIINYYLEETIESDRRVFYLFQSIDSTLQDLKETKSFSLKDHKVSSSWLQQIIRRYQLKPSTNKNKTDNSDSLHSDSHHWFAWESQGETDDDANSVSSIFEAASNILANDKIWEATNEWSSQWESEFGKWVRANLSPQFMVDLQLPTDCADVAYTLRWIFAYIHSLPMAVHLGGSNQLFTNESMRPEWKSLPRDSDWKKDRLLRASLEYLLRNTYTHTLMGDSYPIAINTDKLTAGAYHLSLFDRTGHTMLVYKVNEKNEMPVTLLFSTLPKTVRELIPTFYQETESPELYKAGFYKLRWAKKFKKGWTLLSASSIPDYSEEQFHLEEGDANKQAHFLNVYKKINLQFSFETMISLAFDELQARIKDRIKIVEGGFAFCQTNDCSPGSPGEENWSTPNRDKLFPILHERTWVKRLFDDGILHSGT